MFGKCMWSFQCSLYINIQTLKTLQEPRKCSPPKIQKKLTWEGVYCIAFREFKTVPSVSSLKRESTSILHPSSLSFTGCLWNFIFNTNWLFWLSIISRVLFLHICPLFFTFINHHMFFTHLLKNCLKFPRLTISQPVNAHFILLSRLLGTRFQAAFVT